MLAKRLMIAGRVQGVGYRDWMVAEAHHLGVAGWVRNAGPGRVEAVIWGAADAVEELARSCRRGPRLAHVDSIEETIVEPEDTEGFARRPSL